MKPRNAVAIAAVIVAAVAVIELVRNVEGPPLAVDVVGLMAAGLWIAMVWWIAKQLQVLDKEDEDSAREAAARQPPPSKL